MTLKPVSLARFDAYVSFARQPYAAHLGEEVAWYEMPEPGLFGAVIRDAVDGRFQGVVFAPDRAQRYRRAGCTGWHPDAALASSALAEEMRDAASMRPTERLVPASIRQATRENFEYLVATLSKRPAGKKYENYVVNAIWNALADETLRPVTQQYVNRSVQHRGLALVDLRQERTKGEDARRALIDLYFPALRLGVECDEAQHQDPSATKADRARTSDIKRAIPGYEELRVRVEIDEDGLALSPEAVLDQIDEVVRRIAKRKAIVESGHFDWAQSRPLAWRSEKSDWELARDAGVLRAGDGYVFRHNGEVRELFGLGDGTGEKFNSFRSNFELPDHAHVVWCPTLAVQRPGEPLRSTNTGGYLNWIILDSDDVLIGQADPNDESIARRKQTTEAPVKSLPPWDYTLSDEEMTSRVNTADWEAPQLSESDPWEGARRITFVRTKDAVGRLGYQFLGVFTPPIGYRVVDGISFLVCRLESDTVALRR